MSSGLDDEPSRLGKLQRGVPYEEVFPFNDKTARGLNFQAVLKPADEAVRSVIVWSGTDFDRIIVRSRIVMTNIPKKRSPHTCLI
jgi:hypothetical protein